jgi:hypothetical protein
MLCNTLPEIKCPFHTNNSLRVKSEVSFEAGREYSLRYRMVSGASSAAPFHVSVSSQTQADIMIYA